MSILRVCLMSLFTLVLITIVFVMVSYPNTFDSVYANTFLKLIISFGWGFLLSRARIFKNAPYTFWISTILIISLFSYASFSNGYFVKENFFSYCFVLLGYFLGFYWDRLRIKMQILSSLIIIVLLLVNAEIVYPFNTINQMNESNSSLVNQPLAKYMDGIKLIDASGKEVEFLGSSEVYLIEFYFKHCSPYRNKKIALFELNNKRLKGLEIIFIDNGDADDFETFKSMKFPGIQKSYYDSLCLFGKNLKIGGYPFELIVDKSGKIRYVSSGYAPGMKEKYLKNTTDKINEILKNN